MKKQLCDQTPVEATNNSQKTLFLKNVYNKKMIQQKLTINKINKNEHIYKIKLTLFIIIMIQLTFRQTDAGSPASSQLLSTQASAEMNYSRN